MLHYVDKIFMASRNIQLLKECSYSVSFTRGTFLHDMS
jgi:hypothetical protein